MTDFKKAIKTLEFDKIRDMLADCALTEGAAELAKNLTPDTDIVIIKRSLQQTSEAVALMGTKGAPSFYGVKEVYSSLERGRKGATLTCRQLLDIANLLKCVTNLKGYIAGDRQSTEVDENSLYIHFDRLIPDKNVERAICDAIVSEDMIADEASPELYSIRRKIRHTNSKIKDTLQRYITEGKYTKYLQENIVTTRNGRYVIPVKVECKGDIKGLVHDTSSSGATLFIEPIAIVEANNELHMLEIEEGKEIEKILKRLTDACLKIEDRLVTDYMTVTHIAFVFAKGELSYRMRGAAPVINEGRKIQLNKARHPLLDNGKVVPITVYLGEKFDTLVITGPNTGGKTVTLKTIGLFCIMAQSGLHIPAEDGSTLCVLDSVYADIGDEQSIEQSLSTFSAHMKNTVEIVNRAGKRSLCLFDELGAGTDPTEGAALAISILEAIRAKGSLIAATTHYAELKVFALETAGVSNGSCEFDVATLAPTYRLVIGAPGKSNAFAISEKLGLPKTIVDNAKQRISIEEKRFETVISQLENERVAMEKNREAAEKLKAEYEAKYKKYTEELEKKQKESEKMLERAKAEAQSIIRSAKASANYVMDELNAVKKKQNEQNFAEEYEKTRRQVKKSLEEADDKVNPASLVEDNENYTPPRPYKKGDEVYVVSLGRNGFLENDPDKSGNVSVKSGIFSTRTNVKNLRLVEGTVSFTDKTGKTTKAGDYTPAPIKSFSMELDIRGETGEDGWEICDKYIDEAIVMKMSPVRIIHGKGTGALKRYLWIQFKKDKRIKSFRMAEYGEGDGGVTVLELK